MTDVLRFDDLALEVPVPERGIHSQTLSDADGVTLVLFFGPEQGTSSVSA